MNIYTIQNAHPIPARDSLGSWVRVTKRGEFRSRPLWNVTYENCVGGTVGYIFRTKRDALEYAGRFVQMGLNLTQSV